MFFPLCVQPGALLAWPGLPGERVNPSSLEQTLRALLTGLTGLGQRLDMCGQPGGVWPRLQFQFQLIKSLAV